MILENSSFFIFCDLDSNLNVFETKKFHKFNSKFMRIKYHESYHDYFIHYFPLCLSPTRQPIKLYMQNVRKKLSWELKFLTSGTRIS